MFADRVDISDEARSSCPSTAHNERILENRKIIFHDMKTILKGVSLDFYAERFAKLVQHWDKCLNSGGTYVEK